MVLIPLYYQQRAYIPDEDTKDFFKLNFKLDLNSLSSYIGDYIIHAFFYNIFAKKNKYLSNHWLSAAKQNWKQETGCSVERKKGIA